MAKAKITGVWMNNGIYTVKYATGTEKIYPANKLPKTVLSWIDSNQKSEQATEPEPVKASERMEVMEMRNTEIITTATASARSPKASEVIMFWLCAGLAIGLQIVAYSVIIAFEGIRSFVLYMYEHRQEISERMRAATATATRTAKASARIIKAESVKAFEIFTTATATAYNYVIASLPKLETVKDTIIIYSYETIRAMIITVSILAFTARITTR